MGPSEVVFDWTELSHGHNLTSHLASPASTASLVLLHTFFTPARQYQFQVTARSMIPGDSAVEQRATTRVSVWTAVPPVPGSCGITPPSGEAGITLFRLTCEGWGNSSLRFAFSIRASSSLDETALPANGFFLVVPLGPASWADIMLPAGEWIFQARVEAAVDAHLLSYPDSPGPSSTVIFPEQGVRVQASTWPRGCQAQELWDEWLSQSGSVESFVSLVFTMVPLLMTTPPYMSCQLAGDLWSKLIATFGHFALQLVQERYSSFVEERANLVIPSLAYVFDALVTTEYITLDLVDSVLHITADVVVLTSSAEHVRSASVQLLHLLLERVPCADLQLVLDLLEVVGGIMLQHALPQERIDGLLLPSLSLGGQRVDVSHDNDLYLAGVALHISALHNATGASVLDVSVSQHSSDDVYRRCRPSSTENPTIGPVTVITIRNTQDNVGSANVSFLMPVDEASMRKHCSANTDQLQCGWWDRDHWSTDGCKATSVVQRNATSFVVCECTHLTEFALLLLHPDGCGVSASSLAGFAAFMALYVAGGFFAVGQCVRLWTPFLDVRTRDVARELLTQHARLAILCILRAVTCAVGSRLFPVPVAVLGIIAALPYLLIFWVYSNLIFHWGAIHHLSLKMGELAFSVVRPAFLAINAAVMVLIVFLFVTFSYVESESARMNIAEAGTALLVVMSVGCGVLFGFYAWRIYQSMGAGTKSTKSAGHSRHRSANSSAGASRSRIDTSRRGKPGNQLSSESKSKSKVKSRRSVMSGRDTSSSVGISLRTRIGLLGCIVGFCLIVQGFLWALSGVAIVAGFDTEAAHSIYMMFLTLDCVAVCTLLVTYVWSTNAIRAAAAALHIQGLVQMASRQRRRTPFSSSTPTHSRNPSHDPGHQSIRDVRTYWLDEDSSRDSQSSFASAPSPSLPSSASFSQRVSASSPQSSPPLSPCLPANPRAKSPLAAEPVSSSSSKRSLIRSHSSSFVARRSMNSLSLNHAAQRSAVMGKTSLSVGSSAFGLGTSPRGSCNPPLEISNLLAAVHQSPRRPKALSDERGLGAQHARSQSSLQDIKETPPHSPRVARVSQTMGWPPALHQVVEH